MSSAQLSFELYKWLNNLQLIPGNHQYKSSGNFQLDSKTYDTLISGYALSKFITIVATEKKISINGPLLASMKNSNTPAARIYNWNILQQNFVKLGISLPKQTQKQIITGNFGTLVNFLTQLRISLNPKKTQKQRQQYQADDQFDLKRVKNKQTLSQTETVLEFIILLVCKHFKLTPKQAVATLSENGKYYAHMVVKGIKGSYSQVIDLYHNLVKQMDKLIFMAEKSPQKNTQFILELLKPSLISREQDVAKAGAQALKAFIDQSLKYNSKNMVYQLLCKPKIGFDFIYMSLKRHPSIVQSIYGFLFPLTKNCIKDFFLVQFKNCINDQNQYLQSIIIVLPAFLVQQESKKLLYDSQTIDGWIQMCKQSFVQKSKIRESSTLQTRKLLYLQLLCQLWKNYAKQLSNNENQQLLMTVIQQLKKNTRKQNYLTKIPALIRLFDFLQYLANQKNRLASLVYKKIIFLFVQNHEDTELREIILENFTLILQKFATIPIQYLVEPLLKQLTTKQGKSYILNLYDIEFMIQICRHPKLESNNALSLYDYFAKLYIKTIIMSKPIFRILQLLTARFCQQSVMTQYFISNTEYNLNIYGILIFGKKKLTKQQIITNNQKKSQIIQLIKLYFNLEHMYLTEQLKIRIVKLYTFWVDMKNYRDKGLEHLLQLFGNIQDVCLEVTLKENQSKKSPTFNQSNLLQSTEKNNNIESNEDSFLKNQFLAENSLGYKKKALNVKERLQNLLSSKPQQKVIEDIEKYKQKAKIQRFKKQLQDQIIQKKQNKRIKLNQNQLLQRNLSLGYAKLPQLNQNNIIFDFDSVKMRHLKQAQEFIDLNDQQNRQLTSTDHILQKYKKYIKIIFNKYAFASFADQKNAISSRPKLALSYTEIMRMLKDKGLNKIPKMIVNQIMVHINQSKKKQRNILGGIDEQDFNQFIIQLTYILAKIQKSGTQCLPFGLQLEQNIYSLLQGQKTTLKQLQDPNIIKYKQKLNEQINKQQQIEVPQGYKKIKQNQLELIHQIKLENTNISKSFIQCYQIVDWIYQKALNSHIISPIIQIVMKETIYKLPRVPKLRAHYTMQKNIKIEQSHAQSSQQLVPKKSFQISNKKTTYSHKNLSPKNLSPKNNKTIQIIQQQKKKHLKRLQHAEKLKQQLEKLRENKQQKQKDEKKKKQQQQQKKRKKQQIRKIYLDQNKKKLKSQKQREEQQKQSKEKEEQIKKQKDKQKIKQKQLELLQQEKKRIQQKIQKRNEKQKIKQDFMQKQQKLAKDPKLANKVLETLQSKKQNKLKELELKNSLQKGQLKKILDKHQKQLTQLYHAYWTWDKQKIQLNSFALMLRDFSISPEYIYPKTIAQGYKSTVKGGLMDFKGFVECLGKLAYKTDKPLDSELQAKQQQLQINPKILQKFLYKMKMNQPNYKQIVKHTKQHI